MPQWQKTAEAENFVLQELEHAGEIKRQKQAEVDKHYDDHHLLEVHWIFLVSSVAYFEELYWGEVKSFDW